MKGAAVQAPLDFGNMKTPTMSIIMLPLMLFSGVINVSIGRFNIRDIRSKFVFAILSKVVSKSVLKNTNNNGTVIIVLGLNVTLMD